MKTALDPRHIKRQRAVKSLFSFTFQKGSVADPLAQKIVKDRAEIDDIVTKSAPEWPIHQINRLDLAILRLAIYELVINPKEPPKVIIDEAVELAKRYGSEKSPGFVNGVLGTVFKMIEKSNKKKESPQKGKKKGKNEKLKKA